MIPKPIIAILVYSLPILVVTYGVLMGGFTLAEAFGDSVAALVLRYAAIGALILLLIDLILLVGALGVNALADRERPSD